MKTAMQEHIEEIQYWKEKAPIGSAFRDCLIILEGDAINKLEKEKEQLIETFDSGTKERYYGESGVHYYNQKFNKISN